MKKALWFFVLCCGLLSALHTYAQKWQWARAASCSSPLGGSEGWLTKTDPSDNVFMVGMYYGDSICIDIDRYYNPVNSANNVQTLIVKYDTGGNLLWSHAASHGLSRPISITTDHKGNLYVFGYFSTDSIRFDDRLLVNPGFDFAHPTANTCYYLVKYDNSGVLLWATNGTGNFHPDGDYLKPGGIAADADGDIYISATYNTAKITIGADSLSNADATNNTNDIFIAKYNTSGNILWSRSYGGSKDDYVLDVACNSNKIFITGYFKSNFIDFGATRLFNSSKEGYIACLDIYGNVLWARNAGGKGVARSLAADKKGNVYVGGGFTDTLSFDANTTYSATGGYFVIKYDSAGNMGTPKIMTPTLSMISCCDVYSMATDACNNIWVSVNLEPGKGVKIDNTTTVYPPAGSTDPTFFAGFDPSGNLLDHVALPSGGGYNTGLSNTGLSADSKGAVIFSGDYRALDPFIVGNDTLHLYNNQQTNIFVAKYQTSFTCATPPPPVYPSVPVIKVYPDPAVDMTVLSYTGDLSTGATMTLRDITGRMIRIYPLTTQLTPFSVADLPSGTYLCMIKVAGREIYTLRLVVLR